MSLPAKNQKEYLEIVPIDGGFAIRGHKIHIDELAPLFLQYGMSCRRVAGEDVLEFTDGVDKGQVEQLLHGYKSTTGS